MKNQKYIIEVSEKYADYMECIAPGFQDIAKELSEVLLTVSDDLLDAYCDTGVDDERVQNLSILKDARVLFNALASCSISKYEESETKSNE